jgi:hypothetical protein
MSTSTSWNKVTQTIFRTSTVIIPSLAVILLSPKIENLFTEAKTFLTIQTLEECSESYNGNKRDFKKLEFRGVEYNVKKTIKCQEAANYLRTNENTENAKLEKENENKVAAIKIK